MRIATPTPRPNGLLAVPSGVSPFTDLTPGWH